MNLLLKNILGDLIYSASKHPLGKLRKFHNKHKGESCYIFGDGVSLKHMDLSVFSDREGIACNYFPFHNQFDLLSCSYCINCSPFIFSPIGGYESIKKKHLYAMSKLYRELIDKYKDKNFFVHLSNYPFLSEENIYYMYKDIPDERLVPDFLSKRIACFNGVMNTAVLLAVYLGFEKVTLVGFDYTHEPSKSMHWYEKGPGIYHEQPNYQKEFFTIAKEFVDMSTITLEGRSSYINAVTYKEHTGQDPQYRENIELAEERYLKTLSSWPGYSIF